ncbi:MAG: response regulator [Candidatus Thermoplasmatota archaeon]|nr:response regulator [Candidatus Thermoplasmatota archaeon]
MGKRILIVEDERDMQDLMKIYINKAEIDVELHSAFTGEDGVKMYEDMSNAGKKPDLVIMDLKLPGVDGVETTKRIMNLDGDARIYGFTAFFDTKWANELKDAGAKGVIPRPIGFEGFVGELKKILGT